MGDDGKSAFEVGLFGITAGSGLSMTLSEDRWVPEWPRVLEVARLADDAQIDFILPLQTWRGYGGETDPAGWCYETFTTAAALASSTSHTRFFCTVHVPFMHPVYAARAVATLDHISAGRIGVNIVCGWRPDEFAMFGQSDFDHQRRYDQGKEWTLIFEQLMAGQGPVDFTGDFYSVEGALCNPVSVQRPRPFLISAGYSDPAREFAAQHCDGTFTIFSNPKISRSHIDALRKQVGENGRNIKIYTVAHVVCREDREEAEEYYRLVADELADDGAIEEYARTKNLHVPVLAKMQLIQRMKMAAGAGTFPIVGDYDDTLSALEEIRDTGFDGVALTFVNYLADLPGFVDNVLKRFKRDQINE